WRRIGFVFPVPKETARALWLSAPAFLGVLWWFVVAPLVGYGTIRLPASAATLALYVGVCLLVGFVEEVYFRGLMLQALKPRGLWLAAIVTSILFGATHALNVLGAASPLYTALQVGYAFALGLLFAALVLVTRLIWPVILAHFLTNLGAYLNSAAGGPISTTVTATDYAMTASVVVVFTAYAVYLLMSKRNSERFA
ncbi:MAG: CPBP family intramembrane glutamic endopeptidase, partial [Ktedonobacterales bacterium]